MSGLHAGCLTAAAVCLAGALFVLAFLPAHPAESRTRMSNRDKYGPWAVITGASDGIGRAIAQRAAEDGFNVVLAARSEAKLHGLAAELAQAHGVETHVVPVDLSQPSGAATLLDAIHDLDVGLAVLAAGFGTIGPLADASTVDELEMIAVNVTAVAQLAQSFAQRMIKRGGGGIVLFGSVLGWQGVPAKRTTPPPRPTSRPLPRGLHRELKPQGVDVLCVAPGPVHTGFATRAGMSMKSAATPDVVADATWSALGHRVTVVPGLQAKFMTASLKSLPRYVRSLILGRWWRRCGPEVSTGDNHLQSRLQPAICRRIPFDDRRGHGEWVDAPRRHQIKNLGVGIAGSRHARCGK